MGEVGKAKATALSRSERLAQSKERQTARRLENLKRVKQRVDDRAQFLDALRTALLNTEIKYSNMVKVSTVETVSGFLDATPVVKRNIFITTSRVNEEVLKYIQTVASVTGANFHISYRMGDMMGNFRVAFYPKDDQLEGDDEDDHDYGNEF